MSAGRERADPRRRCRECGTATRAGERYAVGKNEPLCSRICAFRFRRRWSLKASAIVAIDDGPSPAAAPVAKSD